MSKNNSYSRALASARRVIRELLQLVGLRGGRATIGEFAMKIMEFKIINK